MLLKRELGPILRAMKAVVEAVCRGHGSVSLGRRRGFNGGQSVPRGFNGGRQIAIARSSFDGDPTLFASPLGIR